MIGSTPSLSPKPRLTARFPLTRATPPSAISTLPPQRSIRARSFGWSGLWSVVSPAVTGLLLKPPLPVVKKKKENTSVDWDHDLRVEKETRFNQLCVRKTHSKSSLLPQQTPPQQVTFQPRAVSFVSASAIHNGPISLAQQDPTVTCIDHEQLVLPCWSLGFLHHAHRGSGATGLLRVQKLLIYFEEP